MNAVSTLDQPNNVAPISEGATLLSVISRAASDPSTDVEKMERLMTMYERLQGKQSEAEFASDMAKMQAELPSIGERGNAAGRYTYALWEDINVAIKPILQRHGFALSFRTNFDAGIGVTAVLSHRGGHKEQTSIVLPADPSGNKNAVQAVASSVSYGKRYTAGALLNLTSHGEDDDGFSGGGGYDISSWADAIREASSMEELNSVGSELKAQKSIPAQALRNIRALWAKRSKELSA